MRCSSQPWTNSSRDGLAEAIRLAHRITFLQELRLLTISSSVTVSVTIARVVSDGEHYPGPVPRWEVQRIKFKKSDLVLIVRLDVENSRIKDYFLLPTTGLPKTRDGRIRISNRVFGEFRYDTFVALMSALHQRLGGPSHRS
jgi:hypothetical protein